MLSNYVWSHICDRALRKKDCTQQMNWETLEFKHVVAILMMRFLRIKIWLTFSSVFFVLKFPQYLKINIITTVVFGTANSLILICSQFDMRSQRAF